MDLVDVHNLLIEFSKNGGLYFLLVTQSLNTGLGLILSACFKLEYTRKQTKGLKTVYQTFL